MRAKGRLGQTRGVQPYVPAGEKGREGRAVGDCLRRAFLKGSGVAASHHSLLSVHLSGNLLAH